MPSPTFSRSRAPLPAGVLLAACTATSGLFSQAPSVERFLGVKEWSGHLSITVTASGTLDLDEHYIDYTLDRRLSYPFTLKQLGGVPGTWTTCDVSLSRGTIDDTFVDTYVRSGCKQTIRQIAGASLSQPPGVPNSPPGSPPCVLNGFQLQILPVSESEVYTSWGFYDVIEGEQALSYGGGGNCTDVSTTNPWGAQFLGGDARPICQGLDCLTLPREGLAIQQTWSFDSLETVYSPRVPVSYDVRLELTACGGDAELIVEPLEYESWRPMGGEDEDDPGNDLVITAKLQGKGGCATELKARRFRMELTGVSSEPGVCMNWPPEGSAAGGKLDLVFLPDRNSFGEWQSISTPGVTLVSNDGSYSESPRAYITSFDWGARAVLRVTAELVDGRTIEGRLIDDDVTAVPIPRRKNGSKIATSWRSANGVSELDDSSDEENQPAGDGHGGDGLHLYEEYRGFYAGDSREHIEGNPKRKDFFIVDRAGSRPGIDLFRKVSGLEVHDNLLASQVSASRVVNFNRSGDSGNPNDQHAIVLVRAALREGLVGDAVGGPGLPAFVRRIELARSFRPRSVTAQIGGSEVVVTQESFVTAHELFHACNVFHHGESGGKVNLEPLQVGERLVYSDGEAVVPVLKEGPCGRETPILPRSRTDSLRGIYVATQGGKHSGQADCILRYNFAKYYTDETGSRIWRHDGEEPPGFRLCNSAAGTGPGGCLTPRYGDASVGCCARQLCVNDARDHTPGEIPANACGGGGGDGAGEGGGQAPEPELEPRITLAVNESRAPTIHRGWPVLVTVQAHSPAFGGDGAAGDLVLTSTGASWDEALRFEVETGGAPGALWPLVPFGARSPRLTLTATGGGLYSAWIQPEESVRLAEGAHRLHAALDTTSSPEGWIGRVSAPPVEVAVVSEPSPLPPELAAEKALTFALWHASRGALAAALAAVDGLLEAAPELPAALVFRAEILERAGNESAALEAYESALNAFLAATPDPAEWPAELVRSLDALQEKLLIDGAPEAPRFRRGDTNADAAINLSDAITTLGHLFLGNPRTLGCERSADADDSGALNITDAVYVLAYLFIGTAPPPPPFAACGPDATTDALACTTQAGCAP